ncbi:hypothetical protein [Desulfothermus sp.]
MSNRVNLINRNRASLFTDFGHSPIGRFGNRNVRAEQVPIRRSQNRGVFGRIKNLFSRRIRISSASARFRSQVEEVSVRSGDIIGLLISMKGKNLDIQKMLDHFGKLRQEALKLCSQDQSLDYKEILRARFDIHLNKLSNEQLNDLASVINSREFQSLKEQLSLSNKENFKNLFEDISILEQRVREAQGGRISKDISIFTNALTSIKQSLSSNDNDKLISSLNPFLNAYQNIKSTSEQIGMELPASVQDAFNEIKNSINVTTLSDTNLKDLKNILSKLKMESSFIDVDSEINTRMENIKNEVNNKLQNFFVNIAANKDKVADQFRALKDISNSMNNLIQKMRILQSPPLNSPTIDSMMDFIIDSHIRQMGSNSLNVLKESMENINIVGFTHELNSIISDLQKRGISCKEAEDFSLFLNTFKNTVENNLIEKQVINKPLAGEEKLTNSHYRLLRELAGVDRMGVTATLAGTRGPSAREFDKLSPEHYLTKCVDMLYEGRFSFLNFVRVSYSANSRMYLGVSQEKTMDAYSRHDLKKEYMTNIISQADDNQLLKIYGNLTSPDIVKLRKSITDAGINYTGTPSDEELMARGKLSSLGEFWDLMEIVLEDEINKRGLTKTEGKGELDIKGPGAEHIEKLLNRLINQLASNIKTVESINKDESLMDVKANLEKKINTDNKKLEEQEGLFNRKALGVCEQFFLDLNRGHYLLDDGENSVLFDRSEKREISKQEMNELKRKAIDKLEEFVGGDRELLFKVSKYANQASLGPIEEELIFNRFKGANGESFLLNTLKESVVYTFSKKENGDIQLKINNTRNLKEIILKDSGETIPLNPIESTLNISLTLTIPRKGDVTIDNATYNLKTKEGLDLA